MPSVEEAIIETRLTRLRGQRDELTTQLTRLDQARLQAQASLNAVIGAIAVLEDLVSAPAIEPAPEKPKQQRALPNGDARVN